MQASRAPSRSVPRAHSLRGASDRRRAARLFVALALCLIAATVFAETGDDAEPPEADHRPEARGEVERRFEFPDALGNPTTMSPEELPDALEPAGDQQHLPAARRGKKASEKRLEQMRAPAGEGWAWFSSKQPGLAPYLSGLDEYGNSAVRPGALCPDDPVSAAAQRLKYALADHGFYYLLAHGFEYVSLTHVPPAAQNLGYYSFDFFFKQSLLRQLHGPTASWLSGELYGDAALGQASRRTNPAAALQSVTAPASSMWGFYGLAVAELALQQSLGDRGLVAVAGLLDQTNYLDTNAYANFSLGQFQNSAFVNSQVLPITAGNLGLDLQWQPLADGYVILGVGPNNAPPHTSPFDQLGFDDFSYVLEAGYVPDDLAGLGSGAYRLEPFVATVGGVTQAGIGFNFDQQLGRHSPLGAFGRLGVGGATVTNVNGARAQVAAGLVLARPLALLEIAHEPSVDFFGFGFVWSQPSADLRPAAHENEYGVELMYSVQITPTVALTPDLQVLWNLAGNAAIADSLVFQIPLVVTW